MSIVLQDLVKQFGPHTVVDHLSLEIHDGELLVLLGPSGSGKSTILRLIAGLIPADSGRIFLHGRDVTALAPQQRNTGFVFQNYSLFRHMTVAENIEFGLSVRKVARAQREAKREELLALVGLAGMGNRLPRQLSGGQQQRVAVARALVFEPAVLLMDEPFGALDVKIREQLRAALKEIQRKLKITTILVTHDQEEAFELGDRIGVIEQGKLLEVGAPTALYRSPQQEFVATFLGGANLLAGKLENGRVNLGALRLSDAVAQTTVDPEGRLEVLFRPEDLTLAVAREELDIPVLGQGVIEESLFLGTLERVRLRLQPLPGTWSLPTQYGESGVPVQIARIPRRDGHLDFQVGQQVWVGINNFHVLPRIPIRLLIGIEDEEALEQLQPYAVSLARATGGPVTVMGLGETEAASAQLAERARECFAPHLSQLELRTRSGRVPDELIAEIQEGLFDLVLIEGDLRKQTSLRAVARAREIARRSPIPVLVVKGQRTAIRRILFCTAGGEPGKRDVVFGGRLARRTGAQTTLLYVNMPLPSFQVPLPGARVSERGARDTRPWIERHLQQGAQTLLNQGIRTEIRVRDGIVSEEILGEAASGDYDLIVVGAHQTRDGVGLRRPDVASDILARADRPVLVVNVLNNR